MGDIVPAQSGGRRGDFTRIERPAGGPRIIAAFGGVIVVYALLPAGTGSKG